MAAILGSTIRGRKPAVPVSWVVFGNAGRRGTRQDASGAQVLRGALVAPARFGFYKTTEDHPFSKVGGAHLATLSVAVSIGFQLIAMLATAFLASVSTRRGWASLRSSGATW